MPPLVSIIIPVWNGARFLAEALESVRAQGDPHTEVLLVDDGSTDATAEIAARYPEVRYFYQENQGPSAARNKGLTEARGEIIAFLDVDDLWPVSKLSRQRARLEDDPFLDLVLGRVQYVSLEGAAEMPVRFEGPEKTVSHIHLGSGLYRRKAFDRIGGFNPGMRFSEDQDWFLRAREASLRITILEDVTLLYRLHEGNMTRGRGLQKLEIMSALQKSIARRRQAGQQNLGAWRDFDEKPHPLVSVIIPAYNGERFLAQAIESVLAQDYAQLEVIVIDDGSTDASAQVASSFSKVRVVTQPNAGVAAARNHGIRIARGELIGFLDQDDLWVPGRLVGQVRALMQRPEVAMVMGRQLIYLEPGVARPHWLKPELLQGGQAGYNLGAILVRRTVLDRTGPFDEGFDVASDVDWFFRAKDMKLSILQSGEASLRHRIHDTNQSNRLEDAHREYVRLAHRSLQRMRQGAHSA